jgi:Mg-chelatase subunit ChlD
VAGWVRKVFTSAGLTQCPPGPHHDDLQRRFGRGSVILCVDVSGSMSGRPLEEAVNGARRFLAEAIDAKYKVGLILWSDNVDAHVPLSSSSTLAEGVLEGARIYGGTDLVPALHRCEQDLAGLGGDRVVGIFSDGEVIRLDQVLATVARMKADNIRFVTRGLGRAASWLETISSDEDASAVEVSSVDTLADDIAAMSRTLGVARRRPQT